MFTIWIFLITVMVEFLWRKS